VAASFGLSLAPAVTVADWLRRERGGGMGPIEPTPVIRDGQVI